MVNNNITKRIPIDINNQGDKYINVKLEQDYDFLETLSLKLDLSDAYKNFSSDYGCVVGRVSTSSVGIPNVKVSIFLEKDINNSDLINTIYPFSNISDKNNKGVKYNLLPDEQQSSCHVAVGNFNSKRKILDNPNTALKVFDSYYKYSTVTNSAGDFMIFGVPVGTYSLVINLDTSDIGYLSQAPYDLMNQGYSKTMFSSPTKYKSGTNLDSLVQIITQNNSVTVVPFWTNSEDNKNEVGITRSDFDINSFKIEPTAFFIGSAFTDADHHAVNRNGMASKDTGHLDQLETGEGKISILREMVDGSTEEYEINGGRLIDTNGAWAFQIPMNLDYKITDEFGNLIDSEDTSKGIPTSAKVRFKIELDDNEANNITAAKYLVPNNPNEGELVNYSFNETCFTSDSFYTTLRWNKIYSVKNFISRYQKAYDTIEERKFIGLKAANESSANLNLPFNKVDTVNNAFFSVLCILTKVIIDLIKVANPIIKNLGGSYIHIMCNGINYKPGCKNCNPATGDTDGSATNFKNCIGNSLARSMQIFSFDFYNNWLNGSLYFPKLRYKTNSKGVKESFSSFDKGFTVGSDGYTGRIVDMCTYNTNKPNSSNSLHRSQGLFKYDSINDEFYYSPVLEQEDNNPIRRGPFLRTDIINLGSTKSCDIDNYPVLYKKLKPTSFNKSPLIKEMDETNDYTVGLVGFNTTDALVLNIGCVDTLGQENMCDNLNRLCEIGVGLDGDKNNKIDDSDVDNFIVRRMFMYCNGMSGSTITGSFNGYDYDNFRNINNYGSLRLSSTNGNSFYFYFGLKQGKTALDKLKNNYLTDCNFVKTASYYTLLSLSKDVNGLENIINVDINGGIAPYLLELYSNDVFISSGNTNGINSYLFTELETGNYKVVCVDSKASVTTKEIYVPGKLTLDFTVSTVPNSIYNVSDGKIIINRIFNGKAPYQIQLSGDTIQNVTTTGTSYTFSDLPIDNYYITITDGDSISKSKPLILDSLIKQLTLSDISITPQGCPDGLGKYAFRITGGVQPYKLNFNGTDYTTIPSYLGLVAGNYNLTVSDNNVQQTFTTGFTITHETFTVTFAPTETLLLMTFTGSFSSTNPKISISFSITNNTTISIDKVFDFHTAIITEIKIGDGDFEYTAIDNNTNCTLSGTLSV